MQADQPKRGRGRPRKEATVSVDAISPVLSPAIAHQSPTEPEIAIPDGWIKGQLLNVRHAGPGYRVTLLGEEYDPRYPHRCLEFADSFECQQFVSQWYARQSHDPRAG